MVPVGGTGSRKRTTRILSVRLAAWTPKRALAWRPWRLVLTGAGRGRSETWAKTGDASWIHGGAAWRSGRSPVEVVEAAGWREVTPSVPVAPAHPAVTGLGPPSKTPTGQSPPAMAPRADRSYATTMSASTQPCNHQANVPYPSQHDDDNTSWPLVCAGSRAFAGSCAWLLPTRHTATHRDSSRSRTRATWATRHHLLSLEFANHASSGIKCRAKPSLTTIPTVWTHVPGLQAGSVNHSSPAVTHRSNLFCCAHLMTTLCFAFLRTPTEHGRLLDTAAWSYRARSTLRLGLAIVS